MHLLGQILGQENCDVDDLVSTFGQHLLGRVASEKLSHAIMQQGKDGNVALSLQP